MEEKPMTATEIKKRRKEAATKSKKVQKVQEDMARPLVEKAVKILKKKGLI